MRAVSLQFRNVRIYEEAAITDFASKINVLTGPNGAGKTSVLEALSFTTLTKSFSSHTDSTVVRTGEKGMNIHAGFLSDLSVQYNVRVEVACGPPARKSIFANNERLKSAADLIGRSPVVILTPNDRVITSGPPQERRRFLNIVLSQASKSYLTDELEYKRVLKQRNNFLTRAKQDRKSISSITSTLAPWTAMLLTYGSRLMARRSEFLTEFAPHLYSSYELVAQKIECPKLRYAPMGFSTSENVSSVGDFQIFLRQQQEKVAHEEIQRGTTLFGPHRDDIQLFIDPEREARLYASQGQHKTLLVAMKLAEFEYLKEATNETPILLLDDVFSELDHPRAERLLELAQKGHLGQTFITSTDRRLFQNTLTFGNGENQMFQVREGRIESIAN